MQTPHWPRGTFPKRANIIVMLTYFHPDKMAAILADDIFKCTFINQNDSYSNFQDICSQESNGQ